MSQAILQCIFANAKTRGEKTALKKDGQSISYATLALHIQQAAASIQQLGVKRGDCILLSGENSPAFVCAYFATHLCGAISVVVDGHSSALRLSFICSQTKPRIVLGALPIKEAVDYDRLKPDNEHSACIPTDGMRLDDVCDILFTTGTTGTPKGVCLSHRSELRAAEHIAQYMQCRDDDIELLALPLCHSFGLGRLRLMLSLGATVVLTDGFANVKKLFNVIEQEHVTGLAMVPAAWNYLYKTSGERIAAFQHQLRYIEIGSAPMPTSHKLLLCQLLPHTRLCMHYGLTEASRSTFLEFHSDNKHLDSIGRSAPGTKTVCLDENGKPLADNEEGEICVSGEHVMKHYLNEQDNRKAWHGSYFRTGDWGYRSDDGFFYLIGRGKEIINVGGKKLAPEEVEEAIMALGQFSDCACIGVPDPKGVLGCVVKCFAVAKEGIPHPTIGELHRALQGQLESYKIPALLEFSDRIPYTTSGKKQRLLLTQ